MRIRDVGRWASGGTAAARRRVGSEAEWFSRIDPLSQQRIATTRTDQETGRTDDDEGGEQPLGRGPSPGPTSRDMPGSATAVVSYVVNNGPRPVAPATAGRVRDAIAVLGYQPNANARALKLGTAGLLGLLVPDTGNPFFAEYALAIEQAAAERGLALLIANSGSDLDAEARLIDRSRQSPARRA